MQGNSKTIFHFFRGLYHQPVLMILLLSVLSPPEEALMGGEGAGLGACRLLRVSCGILGQVIALYPSVERERHSYSLPVSRLLFL